MCACVRRDTLNGRWDADDKLQPVHITHPIYMTCRTQALIRDDRRIHRNCRNVSTFQWADRFVFNKLHALFWCYDEDCFPVSPSVPELTVLQRLGANYTSVNSATQKIPYFFSYFCAHIELVLHITSSDNLALCLLIRPDRWNTALTLKAGILIKGYNIKKLYPIPDKWFSGTYFFPEDRGHLKFW